MFFMVGIAITPLPAFLSAFLMLGACSPESWYGLNAAA